MEKFRRLVVSFTVLFALMFCFGTSLQAASVEETVAIRGPVPIANPTPCAGGDVGRASIEHRDQDLAERIVGIVLDKDKDDDSLTVTIRFRNGPPNARIGVAWVATNTPGDCLDTAGTVGSLAVIETDSNGRARERIRLFGGNLFPGMGVKLRFCVLSGGCQAGNEGFTALFTEEFPPGP